MITLGENQYGKSRVRVMKVHRHPGRHELHDWTVELLLQGDFQSCFIDGDNSKILPTDTMKNTVYSLAKDSSAGCIEDFAKEMIEFLLSRNSQISAAEINVSEAAWNHLKVGSVVHPTTFVQAGGESQTTSIKKERGAEFSVASGLDNLIILKTAGSAFEGYMKDSLTTLRETNDGNGGPLAR